ncbi:trypsin-like peptidase domain-containing protein [Kitasatospora sp. NPDC096077]|uniref:trypsin-like peptidase domain-containing protein n=1 Tax=Kitasatospora sp. NPDC096077 TaxID=3155544 RepID=UPI00332B212C
MPELTQLMEPCPGGYRIQAGDMMTAGTLGAKVLWGDPPRDVLMTAGHIVDNANAIVFQPSPLAAKVQRIGCVTQRSPLKTYRDLDDFLTPVDGHHVVSTFDFAFADVTINPTATSRQIPGIHETDQSLVVRSPRNGDRVRWLGSATGTVLSGRVVDLSGALLRTDRTGLVPVWPVTLIEVEGSTPSRDGDSGAAVVAEDGQLIGIHCWGASNKSGRPFTWASWIPPTPQDLAGGTFSASSKQVVLWVEKFKEWRNS